MIVFGTKSKHGYANNVAYYAFNLSASDPAQFKPYVTPLISRNNISHPRYNKIPIQCAEEECPGFSFFYLIFRENAYDYSRKRSLDEIQLPLEIYNILKISVRFLIDIIKLYPFIII